MAEPVPITDFKDLSKLWTGRRQNRNPAQSPLRQVNAVDTETYNGDIFLVADSDGHWLDHITADSVIEFLFHKRYHSAWNFFYNINYDAGVILKLLDKELYSYRQTRKLAFKHGEYDLHYIPNKCLRIKKGHHSASYYDVAQFYGSSLVEAYTKTVGEPSQDYLRIKSLRAEFSPRFYQRNKNLVRNYCIQDCTYTSELAERWVKLFGSTFEFYPQRWISSGYLAEKVLINKGVLFPLFDSIKYPVQDLAFKSYFGGRFEILRRGNIGEAYLYDINSAYPFAMTKIPDLTTGRWVSGKVIHPDAELGFFKITANIPDEIYLPPFPFRANGILVFPSGKFVTYVTLEELKMCKDPSYYKIIESWQYIPSTHTHPYASFIEDLYKKRQELKKHDDQRQLPIKIILNSIYGKTGQKVNRVIGNMFNPVIFAFITGFTRAQLYRFVVERGLERNVVSFATDSVSLTSDLKIDSQDLGHFSLKDRALDVFYLQNGIYRFNDKWKQRGLGKLRSREIEDLNTFEQDGKLYYRFVSHRDTPIRSAIIQNRIADIGKIRPVTRKINLNADRKRLWLGRLESVDSALANDSVPLSLNYFAKEDI